jgi:hypothetical protein
MPPTNALTTVHTFREDTVVSLRLAREEGLENVGNTASKSSSVSFQPTSPSDQMLKPSMGATRDRMARTGVVWVDFQYLGSEDGSQSNPFNTLVEGLAALGTLATNTISFKPGISSETLTINTSVILNAPNSTARIGVTGAVVVFALTTTVTGSGAAYGAGSYAPGSNVTVTASAAGGWAFSHWTGALSGFANPTTVLMDSNKSINAVFAQNPAGLKVTSATLLGGSPLPTSVSAGQSFTIEWNVLNNSANTASSGDSDWIDDVFLSRDVSFSSDDKPLSLSGAIITGPKAGSAIYTASATITVPDVSPGAYFLIVRTDTNGEVSHTAAARAAGVLATPLTLTDPELTL